MKHLYNKLKSRRGASMLFALLVFLLCLLAGVAALTAAAANAGRYTHLESQQQQYLSVASALDVLQAEMDKASAPGGVLTVKAECVETETWDNSTGDSSTPTVTRTVTPDPAGSHLNYFQYLLLKNNLPAGWEDTAFPAGTTTSWTGTDFDISLDDSGTDFALPYPVHVAATSEGYTLQMRLSTKDGGAYPVTAVWSGEPEVTTVSSTKTEGDPTDPGTGKRTTTTTLTCTLRWPAEKRTVTFG